MSTSATGPCSGWEWYRCEGQKRLSVLGTRGLSPTDVETIELAVTRGARPHLQDLREGEDMTDDDALFQKGMPIRREVLARNMWMPRWRVLTNS
jgi:hypothetical protein